MFLDYLDCIHVTFLYYLRAMFRKIGFFVGSHPWPTIVGVNLLTVFCAYAALSMEPMLRELVWGDLVRRRGGQPLNSPPRGRPKR